MDHFSRHGVVLVLSHGAQGSRGVLLEMATAFTVGEMAAALANTPFSDLPLFRGGSGGQDKVLMLHDVADLARSQPVGSHGIHVGGLQSASDAVSQGLLPAERFKFFFNQMEWVPGALEREVSQGIWTPGVIPPALVLRQIGSQSERPLAIERKLGQVTNVEVGKALWDLLHELLPSTASLETLLTRTPPLAPPAPLRDHPQVPTPALAPPANGRSGGGSGGGGGRGAAGAAEYLAGLSRRELQGVARENGVKGNLKSVEIVEQLLAGGFVVGCEEREDVGRPESGEGGGGAGAVGCGGEAAGGQRALFLRMMVERVWEFRQRDDGTHAYT